MDSISVYLSAESEALVDSTNLRVERKLIRSGSSPLDLPDKEFVKLFRLSKEAFVYVLEKVKEDFRDRRASGSPVILKLAATLRFLGEGSYQKAVGQDYHIGMAQPTISIVMSETLKILENKLCPKFIKFEMSERERKEAKDFFYNKSGFPGVILCVAGTHISIIRPSRNEHHFYNKKFYHSINAMMACNHQMKICCINASYGGSAHDSVVWSMSAERQVMENNFNNGDTSKILGDSGYSLEPWMMTPYRSPAVNSLEANYNSVHSRCRSIIERCFGVLKGRFRCLLHARELHYEPKKAARIINVCAMLHNICLMFKVNFNEELLVQSHEDSSLSLPNDPSLPFTNVHVNINRNFAEISKNIRNEIRNSL